jgi:Glycosyltransferase family 87
MRIFVARNGVYMLAAAASVAVVAWLGLVDFAWSDYEIEALPAVEALTHGHLVRFAHVMPVYGGSLVLRAPFALIPLLWGGGQLAIYRALAFPCLLAGAFLGVWLSAQLRVRGAARWQRVAVIVACTANPLILPALELGHPEEMLGGVLCVAAVLLAARGRAVWAGLALGAAIANKEWALVAIVPVLLAAPGRRMLTLGCGGALAVAMALPLAILGGNAITSGAAAAAAPSSAIFQPWQVWWFLGHHGALIYGLFGAPKPGFRIGPAWIGGVSHPLIVAASVPLAVGLWTKQRRPPVLGGSSTTQPAPDPPAQSAHKASDGPRERDALLLLALLLLLRCALDTWDDVYYMLPFVLVLLTWEVIGSRKAPVLTILCAGAAWVTFGQSSWTPSPDVQAAMFLAWVVPVAVALAVALYARERLTARLARAHSTMVSSLGRPLSVSWPSAVTSARSSIRTPSAPGK